jgi:hypothetical protein
MLYGATNNKNMKKLIYLQILLLNAIIGFSQTFQVSVNGGFGSGSFNAGDTVHVFANAVSNSQVFDKWTGNATFIYDNEWHGRFVMPENDVEVSANYRTIPLFSMEFEDILLAESSKKVFYHFPEVVRGTIFLFHEAGGRAQDWLFRMEYNRFLIDAVADSFAVVFFSAQEFEEGILNENESRSSRELISWNINELNLAENIDLQNLTILIDTLKARGIMEQNPKLYAVGMGDGATFGQIASNALGFRAAAMYGTAGKAEFNQSSAVPTQWMLMLNDANISQGTAGNQEAAVAFSSFQQRDICSRIYTHSPSPLYKERILKDPSFDLEQVTSIIQELENENLISDNFAQINGIDFLNTISNNPEAFPVTTNLVEFQQQYMAELMDISSADHQFFSDLNRQTLEFFRFYCGTDTVFNLLNTAQVSKDLWDFKIFPNPADEYLIVNSEQSHTIRKIEIINSRGQLIRTQLGFEERIDLLHLQSGIYFICITSDKGASMKAFIKH